MQTQIEAPRRGVRIYSYRDMPSRKHDPREVLRAHGGGAFLGAVAGGKVAGGGASTPSAIMGANAIAGFRGDTGLTASSWTDIKGGAPLAGFNNCTVVTNAINGMSAAGFTAASSQAMLRTQSLAAPATTPVTFWGIFKATAWSAGNVFCSGGTSSGPTVFQWGSSPNANIQNPNTPGPQSTGAVLNTWVRIRATFTGSASDSLKIGSAAVATGTNVGNATGTHLVIGEGQGFYFTGLCAEYWYINSTVSGTQDTQLDAYATSFYAGLVTV